MNIISDSDGQLHVTIKVTLPGHAYQTPRRGSGQSRSQLVQSRFIPIYLPHSYRLHPWKTNSNDKGNMQTYPEVKWNQCDRQEEGWSCIEDRCWIWSPPDKRAATGSTDSVVHKESQAYVIWFMLGTCLAVRAARRMDSGINMKEKPLKMLFLGVLSTKGISEVKKVTAHFGSTAFLRVTRWRRFSSLRLWEITLYAFRARSLLERGRGRGIGMGRGRARRRWRGRGREGTQ